MNHIPITELLADRNAATDLLIADARAGARAATPTPASPTNSGGSQAMPSIPKSARYLAVNDVIVRHPDHPEREVEYTVTEPPALSPAAMVDIPYHAADGADGLLVLSPTTRVQVRVDERAAFIANMRDMADWLEANPGVPTGRHNELRVQYSVTAYAPWKQDYALACAEVDRVAALIGEEAQDDDGPGDRRREVVKEIGAVHYLALAIEAHTTPPADQEGTTS